MAAPTLEQYLLIAQIALSAAAAIPGVDPKILGLIQSGLDATEAGISGVMEAKQGVDPDKLHDFTPIP